MTDGGPRVAEFTREQGRPGAEAVVVASDAGRLGLYRGALRMAGVPARLTLDADEAEQLLAAGRPSALILDEGLPRAAVLQLYGAVRGDDRSPAVPVVFVGQEGRSGGGDYFLADETSPLAVAAQVSDLLTEAPPAAVPDTSGAPTARPADRPATGPVAPSPATAPMSGPPRSPAAPAEHPATPAAPTAGPPSSAGPPWATERVAAEAGAPSTHAEAAPAAEAPAGRRPRQEPAPSLEDGPAGVTVADAAAPTEPAPAAGVAAGPARTSRMRLDIILLRLGIVLFILGLVVLFFLPSSLPQAVTPPASAPATPTLAPAASPSPAGFVDLAPAPARAGLTAR